MKNEEINIDVVKNYIFLPDELNDEYFSKVSVDKIYFGQKYEYGKLIDVIFIEGKCKVFEGYKSWITIDKYKNLLREYNLNKLINE